MDAPSRTPRARSPGGARQAVLVGLRRLPRPRGSRAAVQDLAGGTRARHGADERVPVDPRAEHGRDHRPPPAGEVLRGARLIMRCHPERRCHPEGAQRPKDLLSFVRGRLMGTESRSFASLRMTAASLRMTAASLTVTAPPLSMTAPPFRMRA